MVDHPLTALNLEKVREAFPVLREVVYLNVGTYGLMPEPALAALLHWVCEFERGGVACSPELYQTVEATRRRIAALIGASPEEIAFTRNANDGINLVIAGLDWQPGDEVITSNEEHPAVQHPLLYLQRRQGVRIRVVEVSPDAGAMRERLDRLATERTRLVAMSHVSSETGTRLPVAEIQRWAAARNILTLFDGAQALGVFPIDVRQIGCDFYASNGHKWLGGPKGTGVFYGRLDRLPLLSPAHVGAGTLERADMASGVAEPWADARRFEFGTRAWPLQAGLGASLDWFEGLGWASTERHIASLSNYLKEQVLERPYLQLRTPRAWQDSSGLTSFTVAGKAAGDVSTALREKWHIYVRVVPEYNAIRISTAHFNSRDDIDRLLAALDGLQGSSS